MIRWRQIAFRTGLVLSAIAAYAVSSGAFYRW
jgi:hypothetical protein